MKLGEVFVLITSILWIIAAIYLIYSVGLGILTLNLQPIITGVLIMFFATVAQAVAGILAE
ncbi:MAG TPA: hypothetical protein VMU13_02060 [Candidatus Paceibacterota bacterium]|nr:hypothetical protein [Candidatus Paceibacterota bacterium]